MKMQNKLNDGVRFPKLGLALMVIMGVGCAQEIGDINRIQPNYQDKKIFTGEWHQRTVVVDKQHSSSYPFIGYEGGLERIRWEITQRRLLAFRSYAKAPGAEGGDAGDQTLIAAFPIHRHFDIRRQYNPINGQENNVIQENDFDRPWWERQYIRVDWSNNLVQDYDLNGWVRLRMGADGVTARAADNDPTNPWRVRVSDDYIETTIEANLSMTPRVCNATGDWFVTCERASAVTRYKMSFKKIDPKKVYEPLLYPDIEPIRYGTYENGDGEIEFCYDDQEGCETRELWVYYNPLGDYEFCDPTRHDIDECWLETMSVHRRFGYFRTERFTYDRETGTALSAREQLINRWNIWENSYDEDGTVIPYEERTIKPITYHLNVMFPENLHDVTQLIAEDWNKAFKDTVEALGVDVDDDTKVFQIVENSCNIDAVNAFAKEHGLEDKLTQAGLSAVAYGNLEKACAVLEFHTLNTDHVFEWEQLGDLRYSFLNWTTKAELSSPLGYGPSAADPMTGEIISANANVYGTIVDRYASWGADIVDLINGTLSEEDLINGTNIREHIENARQRWHAKIPESKMAKYEELFHDRTSHLSDEDYLVQRPLHALNENMHLLEDLGYEDELLMTDEVLRMMAGPDLYQPGTDTSEAAWDRARPSSWGRTFVPSNAYSQNGESLSDLGAHDHGNSLHAFAQKEEFLGSQNFCYLQEMVEPAVADLALQLADKTRDEVYATVRASVYRGVMAHELGHTLGLRHNFEGSADPLNFFSQFWGIGTDERYQATASTNNSELRYSSIMDYHQRFNSDFGGIGLYDKSAIAFGYGELIEIFDQRASNFVPTQWYNSLGNFNYDDLPYLFEGDANDPVYNNYRAAYDAYFGGDRTATVDVKNLGLNAAQGKINMYQRQLVPWRDHKKHVIYRELGGMFGLGNTDFENSNQRLNYEVPYQYCADAFAWGGNLTCNRWDMGATSHEIVGNAAEMYEAYYPFNNFRRDRIMSGRYASGYINRLYQRTYQPMLNAFRYHYYYRRSSAQIWPMIRDWSKASFVGLNFFTGVLGTPESGKHCLNDNVYVPEAEATSCDSEIDIPLGMGRHYTTQWTDEFFYRPEVIGHVWDKVLAVMALTDSAAFFTRDFSSSFNRGAFSIGYYRVFGPELIQYFTNFMKDDLAANGGRVYLTDGIPNLELPSLINIDGEAEDTTAPRIKPSSSWQLRYYATLYPMIRYSSTVDRQLDFGKRSRISYAGGAQDPTVDAAANLDRAVFTHPVTLLEYNAYNVDGAEMAPGYQLLEDANAFVSDGGDWHAANVAYEAAQAAVLAEQEGDNDASTVADLQATADDAENALDIQSIRLQEKVHIIEIVRSLSEALEFSN